MQSSFYANERDGKYVGKLGTERLQPFAVKSDIPMLIAQEFRYSFKKENLDEKK